MLARLDPGLGIEGNLFIAAFKVNQSNSLAPKLYVGENAAINQIVHFSRLCNTLFIQKMHRKNTISGIMH